MRSAVPGDFSLHSVRFRPATLTVQYGNSLI